MFTWLSRFSAGLCKQRNRELPDHREHKHCSLPQNWGESSADRPECGKIGASIGKYDKSPGWLVSLDLLWLRP